MGVPFGHTFFVLAILTNQVLAQFELLVLHTGDVHSHYDYITFDGKEFKDTPNKKDTYGSMARLQYKADELRGKHKTSLYLSAGDYLTGTREFSIGKNPEIVAGTFVAYAKHDAMVFGNHEFDKGEEFLTRYMDMTTWITKEDEAKYVLDPNAWPNVYGGKIDIKEERMTRFVACNIEVEPDSLLIGKFRKSVIRKFTYENQTTKETEQVLVGIIGYTIMATQVESNPGKKLHFTDEVSSVDAEAIRLKLEMKVDIVIALGHAAFEIDLKVAKLESVDLVVGGHTNTFLYNPGPPPRDATLTSIGEVDKVYKDFPFKIGIEEANNHVGNYPYVVQGKRSGRSTFLLHSFAYGKFLGKINLLFKKNGDHWDAEINEANPNPILMNWTIPEVPEIAAKVAAQSAAFAVQATNFLDTPIGKTFVDLSGFMLCRREECDLGTLMADAQLLWSNTPQDDSNTEMTVAILNSGNCRSEILLPSDKPKSLILTKSHMVIMHPFDATINLIRITGENLISLFTYSIGGEFIHGKADKGKFLQVSSNMQITYELKSDGMTTNSNTAVTVKIQDPITSMLVSINPTAIYRVSLPTFILNGGEGYKVVSEGPVLGTANYWEIIPVYTKFVESRTGGFRENHFPKGRIKFQWIPQTSNVV